MMPEKRVSPSAGTAIPRNRFSAVTRSASPGPASTTRASSAAPPNHAEMPTMWRIPNGTDRIPSE
ncbi:unannotated protein [freshwater metagenome]|uniref:Unannotated protein n=1 Tax=freshwater metagenome TaxID=449393 RepID=A0A6J7EET6_9ZZZZ